MSNRQNALSAGNVSGVFIASLNDVCLVKVLSIQLVYLHLAAN